MRRSCANSRLLLWACALGGAWARSFSRGGPSINIYSGVDCSLIAPVYCSEDLGCRVEGDACLTDNLQPDLNCTLMLAVSGAAVEEQEAAMMTSLKDLRAISKTVGSSVDSALGSFSILQQKWDACLLSYSQSLLAYTKEAAKLDALEVELTALEKNCTTPDTPSTTTCDKLIAQLQTAIFSQNATCVKVWTSVSLMQQKLSVTDSEVQAGRQEISKATDTAQQTYTDMAAKMASSTKAKQDALNFWDVIKTVCTHAGPSLSRRRTGPSLSSVHSSSLDSSYAVSPPSATLMSAGERLKGSRSKRGTYLV